MEQQNILAYRFVVTQLIRDLICRHYFTDDTGLPCIIEPMSQNDIANYLGVTPAVISRAYNGVTSIKGELFYCLLKLHNLRLSKVCGNPLNF